MTIGSRETHKIWLADINEKFCQCLTIVCCLFSLQAVFGSGVLYGSDFYVSATSGSDRTGDGSTSRPWKTIQYAVEVTAPDPANIHVAPGTYREHVIVQHRSYLHLMGAGAESTTITTPYPLDHGDLDGDGKITSGDVVLLQWLVVGNQQPTPVQFLQGDINEDGILTVHDVVIVLRLSIIMHPYINTGRIVTFSDVSDAKISGFTINGGESTHSGGGISCDRSSVTISDNIIRENSVIDTAAPGSNRGGGIYLGNCSMEIMDNTIVNNRTPSSGGGIYGLYSHGRITRNTIMENDSGISLYLSCKGTGSTLELTDNTVKGNPSYGIFVSATEGASIDIINNIIEENLGQAIGCSGETSGKIQIAGNTIRRNLDYGRTIYCSYCPTLEICDNIIAANETRDYVIRVFGKAAEVNISRNRVERNKYSGYEHRGRAIDADVWPNDTTGSFSLANNIIAENDLKLAVSIQVTRGCLASLDSNTITANSGGGIFCSGSDNSSIAVVNNRVEENGQSAPENAIASLYYAGISCTSSDLCSFEVAGNTAVGNRIHGLYCRGESSTYMEVTGNTIAANLGHSGVGVYCTGKVKLINNIIKNNRNRSAKNCRGVGIYCHGGSFDPEGPTMISYNTITDNEARDYAKGGGIYCSCPAIISNNTIMGNSATNEGGGIYCTADDEYRLNSGTIEITDDTISGNRAYRERADGSPEGYGGGICVGVLEVATKVIRVEIRGGSITGNHAGELGGGVVYNSLYSTLAATVAGNTCDFVPPEGWHLLQDVANILDWAEPYIEQDE